MEPEVSLRYSKTTQMDFTLSQSDPAQIFKTYSFK